MIPSWLDVDKDFVEVEKISEVGMKNIYPIHFITSLFLNNTFNLLFVV